MPEHTLEELGKAAMKRDNSFRRKQSVRYHLARELGFSSQEAVVLQNWSEQSIRELAKQREAKNAQSAEANVD